MKHEKKKPNTLSQRQAWQRWLRDCRKEGNPNTGKTKVAVGYYRTGAGDDGSDGYRQIEAIKKKTESLGVHISAAYVDQYGVRDGEEERPGLALMSKCLADFRVDYVIMDNPDRLSDDKQEAAEMIREIEEAGARVEFTNADRTAIKKLPPAIKTLLSTARAH